MVLISAKGPGRQASSSGCIPGLSQVDPRGHADQPARSGSLGNVTESSNPSSLFTEKKTPGLPNGTAELSKTVGLGEGMLYWAPALPSAPLCVLEKMRNKDCCSLSLKKPVQRNYMTHSRTNSNKIINSLSLSILTLSRKHSYPLGPLCLLTPLGESTLFFPRQVSFSPGWSQIAFVTEITWIILNPPASTFPVYIPPCPTYTMLNQTGPPRARQL